MKRFGLYYSWHTHTHIIYTHARSQVNKPPSFDEGVIRVRKVCFFFFFWPTIKWIENDWAYMYALRSGDSKAVLMCVFNSIFFFIKLLSFKSSIEWNNYPDRYFCDHILLWTSIAFDIRCCSEQQEYKRARARVYRFI